MQALTARHRQYLKGLGHAKKSVMQVGKEGLTERVIASIKIALDSHELIKVTLLETSGLDRHDAAEEIAKRCNALLVQLVGFKIMLYRQNPDKEKRKIKCNYSGTRGLDSAHPELSKGE